MPKSKSLLHGPQKSKSLLHGPQRRGDRPNSKRAKLAVTGGGGGEDHLSALPDDVLIHILVKLRDTAFAARTSILSSRWRRLWALIPEIHFSDATHPRRIRAALVAHQAPAILHLVAVALDASPYSVAAWLRIVAPRLSGDLIFRNMIHRNIVYEERGAFKLPCFENATSIRLDLGFLGLTMPTTGVFALLTDLCLDHVWIDNPCKLTDAISSPRCPALQKLTVRDARCMGNVTIRSGSLRQMELRSLEGFSKLTIHSESLLQMELSDLRNLQLTVMTPTLEELTLSSCFFGVLTMNLLVSSISAPQLLVLKWKKNTCDPSFFELDEMVHLHCLDIGVFLAYRSDDTMYNNGLLMEDVTYNTDSLMLLQRFKVIHKLNLTVQYQREACPSDCPCGQPPSWKSEEFVLDCLQEAEISNLRGTRDEVAFAERLFSWATVLKQMTVTFDKSITESMAIKGFCQKLLSFSRPEICVRFFVYRHSEKVLYVPVD